MYFNTSHVTVYLHLIFHMDTHFIFQYIPCYGLSGQRNDITDLYANFNTSHVTVYLNKSKIYKLTIMYFNTSHVTVYRCNDPFWPDGCNNFNTSHVTVYPIHQSRTTSWMRISIHPMLRFILSGTGLLYAGVEISIHPMLRFIKVFPGLLA